MKDQLFSTAEKFNQSANILLEAVILLIDPKLPWACNIVCYLSERNMNSMLRETVLLGKVVWREIMYIFKKINFILIWVEYI